MCLVSMLLLSHYNVCLISYFLLIDWLIAVNESPDFEDMSQDVLATHLERFYCAARTKGNTSYSKSAMRNIRSGLQRHLANPPYSKNYNILVDESFRQANLTYSGYICKLRRQNLEKTKHKATILEEDVAKLYEHVFDETAQGLQRRVFLEVCLHFGRRGREGLRSLRKDSFEIKRDGNGLEYVTLTHQELEKTRSGLKEDDDETDKKMFADKTDKENCPVENFCKYVEHLNPDIDAFFQASKENFNPSQKIWYQRKPFGVNTLNNMMPKMSEDGNLSQRYTNHCIRKTVIICLDKQKFTPREIQSITGHKSAASLEPYLGCPTHNDKLVMSTSLSRYGKKRQSGTEKKRTICST